MRKIRNTIGYLISEIYGKLCERALEQNPKAENPQAQSLVLQRLNIWSDVFQTINDKTKEGASPEDMEKGLVLLGILLEETGVFMKHHFKNFHTFFLKIL